MRINSGCGYHLFPDFVGGKSEAARATGIEIGRTVLKPAMDTKGASPFIVDRLDGIWLGCGTAICRVEQGSVKIFGR